MGMLQTPWHLWLTPVFPRRDAFTRLSAYTVTNRRSRTLVTIHVFSQMHGVISRRHILQSMEGDIIVEGPYVCDHCNVQGEQYIVRAHWDIKGPMLLQLPRFTYGEAGQVSTSKWRWEDWNLRVLGGIIHSKGSNPSTGHYRVAYPRQRQGHNGVLIIDDAKTYGSNTAPTTC